MKVGNAGDQPKADCMATYAIPAPAQCQNAKQSARFQEGDWLTPLRSEHASRAATNPMRTAPLTMYIQPSAD